MKHKRKYNNTEFYEKVGDGIEKLLDKTSDKIGLKKFGNKIVTWANEHKKATFGIIITFLSVCTLIILIDTSVKLIKPKKDFENPKIAMDSLSTGLQNPMKKLVKQYDEHVFLKKYEDELNTLLDKDTLTQQDSTRLIEIYDEIMEMQIQNYYDEKTQY